MQDLVRDIQDLTPQLMAGAVVLASLLVGILLRRFGFSALARMARKTEWTSDDALVESLRTPLPWWLFFGGVYIATRIVEIPAKFAPAAEKLLLAGFVLSITIWIAGIGARLLELASMQSGAEPGTSTGVMRYAVRGLVFVIGGLVILSTMGISVAPILTTVGIGGIAIALALQDTLGNLFAGMQVTLAGNIRVGDFIRLESGEEGFIEDIHWRATRVRTLLNNVVLIPNNRLAQSVITNYRMPSADLGIRIVVGVHYGSDLDHVEKVTTDVATNIMQTVEGGVPDFAPFIRYLKFGDSSIEFKVALQAKSFADTFIVQHEFIKALSRAYNAEGIVIPFPIRAINLSQEQAASLMPPPVKTPVPATPA